MRSPVKLCSGIMTVSLLFGGCRTANNLQGQAKYEIVDPQGGRPASQISNQVQEGNYRVDYNPGYAKRALPKPTYPRDALTARTGNYVVYVTITIDESGHVTNAVRSLNDFALPSRFAADFFNAVQAAVLQWSFVPAHKIYWQRGANGEMKYIGAEPVPRTMELRFTFDALGGVR